MINLFRQTPPGQGALTASLLALLEHADRALLNDLMRRADIPLQVEADADLKVSVPGPGGSPSTGQVATHHYGLSVYTQAPGEPLDQTALVGLPGTVLAVTLGGTAPEGVHQLSWEQVERWLGDVVQHYDPDSRTGFLVGQFRDYLHELGIEAFPGFDGDELRAAPDALATVLALYKRADQFFDRLAAVLATFDVTPAVIRQARPEDLLAGYTYRDFGSVGLGASNFLRTAVHLPERQFQVACWLSPGAGGLSHARLYEALRSDADFVERLRDLEGEPLLWLWSAQGEWKVPFAEFDPVALEGLQWATYQVAVQQHRELESLGGEGIISSAAAMVETLLGVMAPVLSSAVH